MTHPASEPISRITISAACVLLFAASGAAEGQHLCQPRAGGTGKECFVSLAGNDTNRGTFRQPFRSIARGIRVVQAGDVLSLRKGEYVEPIVIENKHGTASRPIVVRAHNGERVFIDGTQPEFRSLNNEDWERVSSGKGGKGPLPPRGPAPHADEYVSKMTVTSFVRGAFLDREPYTRLIVYSRIEDLRAENETFDKILTKKGPPDLRPGPDRICAGKSRPPEDSEDQNSDTQDTDDAGSEDEDSNDPDSDDRDSDGENIDVIDSDVQDDCKPAPHRYPWVYMGPGIWIDRGVQKGSAHRIHIRLSHTHNNIPSLADYRGEVDPRKLRLAISRESTMTLRIHNSSHLRFEGLDIRYGGNVTMKITGATSLVFDHVRVWASTYGVRTKANTGLTFQHSAFDGGRPSWFFRDDGKTKYRFMEEGDVGTNNLGKQTLRSLFVPSALDTGTTIHHCEFDRGHDLYLGGSDVDFHHNLIYDLNDDGLFLDAHGRANVRVHDNVVLKTLTALSFASDKKGSVETVGGPFFIYRNLIDLRERTPGYRPKFTGDTKVWRYGSAFKSGGGNDGPSALFHNTFVLRVQRGQDSYRHYANLRGSHRRRSFNNIFVDINPGEPLNTGITRVPSPSFPAETDGNNYYRFGHATTRPYVYLRYEFDNQKFAGGDFGCLAGCGEKNSLRDSPLFKQSKTQYAPGYEAQSIESNPRFRYLSVDGVITKGDDLRLDDDSLARQAGVVLPYQQLRSLDNALKDVTPDIGCYRSDGAPLRVGIEGRRSYPASPD
jgi:Protein of unknown function (DUF1565)